MSRRFGLPGKIYFIEVASADALAENASQIVRSAQVVFHDDVVAPGILEFIPTSALVLSVQKSATAELPIHERMIAYADEGKIVVRLAGPGQLSTGRIEEETRAAREADVLIELVPIATESAAAATAS